MFQEDKSTVEVLYKGARVKALAMASLVVEACSRKKRKANGPSKLEKILLRYYTKFGPRNQESRVYLGMNGCDTVSR